MEKPSSRRWSSGGVEEKLPLRGGLETERVQHAHAHTGEQQEAGRCRHRHNCVRAALVLCLLTLPAGVLLQQRWRASSSQLFEFDPPMEDDDDHGTDSSPHPCAPVICSYFIVQLHCVRFCDSDRIIELKETVLKLTVDRDKPKVKKVMIWVRYGNSLMRESES
jgi:xyloglucan fucosyltransferase